MEERRYKDMKEFQNPEMEVIKIAVEDVITTSACSIHNPYCQYETCPSDRD